MGRDSVQETTQALPGELREAPTCRN